MYCRSVSAVIQQHHTEMKTDNESTAVKIPQNIRYCSFEYEINDKAAHTNHCIVKAGFTDQDIP